ncbi:5'-3' exoribonuclease 1 [Nilaparvata lugens]|uniref:5'-3' exoribonuclease 1 n=1 Tax=Nilaparvata lugens TaxID=108931 RepID=UPI00193CB3FA|nr:5'-3' exoribonuclease 1 [Nilaparvata lugens]
MGVPKFFRYISERYPCLSEIVREYQIPEFDNLYLDMNGIIHVCSHPNDFDPHFRITEEDIFKDIFIYIETLFRMIQPKKLFFLAIDGVAPRAKMNQQRGRRFKSAKEAETLEKEALAKGEKLPDVERFDSNCITPGTAFMARLQTELKYWITYKINSDKIWRIPTVILSGHETPGEGEHKIMDYIRFLKSKPDYDQNTRHCLYGLDADLIMLGLCSHEPHFSLLREEVKFNRNAQKKRSNAPDEITFFLLHLSLMREYIELEFQELKETLKFRFDLEKIIDDWVLMGFLVGNDFIPHLPHLHIASGALPILYKAYIDVMPTLDGKNGVNDSSGSQKKNSELAALIKETEELFGDDIYYSESDDEDCNSESVTMSSMMKAEFSQHKNDYYKNKMEFTEVTQDVLQSQAECYVRAIQWNLNYYYNGCCSWSWFYPHHYAPYMSDIRNFSDFKLDFDLGEPFLPFQQLLAVLPAASKKLLPEPFQELMMGVDSPIIDFYPLDFDTDLNGKKQDWEAVVLIPFIEEKKLLKAMEPRYDRLTDEEKRRNSHGPMHIFNYTPEDLGLCELSENYPKIKSNHAEVTTMYREDLYVEKSNLVRGLCSGVKLDTYFPGFPTLKHLDFKAKLEKGNVLVFEQPSRGENMILTLAPKASSNITKLVNALMDQVVHVSWPHLREARISAISDGEYRYSFRSNSSNEKKEIVKEELKGGGKRELWQAEGRTIALEWEAVPTPFAYQTVVENLKVQEDVKGRELTVEDIFKPGGFCFVLATKFYGDMGMIDRNVARYDGKIKLTICHTSEPDFRTAKAIASKLRTLFITGNAMSNNLGLSGHLLSRITGSIFISKDDSEDARKVNVGLSLKFNKKNQEVCGFTKRMQNGMWLYSPKAEQLVRDYMNVASDLICYLSSNAGNDVFCLQDIFPENGEKRLSEITNWLKENTSKLTRQNCGSEVLDEEVIKILVKTVDAFESPETKTSIIQCKPQLLVLPVTSLGRQCPDPAAESKMFDRVRNIRESYCVPLGMKGTIVGVHLAEKECDTSYDVMFDEEFPGGLSLNGSGKRCCRALKQSFINLSYGERMTNAKQQPQQQQQANFRSQNQESSYATTGRNGRNSSAFVSCQDSKEYNKDETLIKALERKIIKFVPEKDPKKSSNETPPQTTQKSNNPVKLLTRSPKDQSRNVDAPSDQLKKLLKISDNFPQQPSATSAGRPLLETPPSTMPAHSSSKPLFNNSPPGTNRSPRKPLLDNPPASRKPLLDNPPPMPNFALANAFFNVQQQKTNQTYYPNHQMYTNVAQLNYGFQGAAAFLPGQQMQLPFRMKMPVRPPCGFGPPPPPFQWQQNDGIRGHTMTNTGRDVAGHQQFLEDIHMQPNRWQRDFVDSSYQSGQGQGQPQSYQPYQNSNRYQFSQSWSGNQSNDSQRAANYNPNQSQGQVMQNASMHQNNVPPQASRPQSSTQEPRWRIACNFNKTPEFK